MADDGAPGRPGRWEPAAGMFPVADPATDDPTAVTDAAVVPDEAAPAVAPRPDPPAPPRPAAPAAPQPPIEAYQRSPWLESDEHLAVDADRYPGPPPPAAWPAADRYPGPPAAGPPGPDTDEHAAPDRRRRGLAWTAGSLAVIAALLVTLVLVTRNADDPPPAAAATTTTPSTTTTAPVGSSGTIDLAAGVKAVIPPDALTPGATLSSTEVDLTGVGGAMVAVSPVLEIAVTNGRQRAPITLVFPVTGSVSPPTGGTVASGVHVHDGRPEFLTGHYDATAKTYRVPVASFSSSTVGVVSWDWDRLDEVAGEAVDAVASSSSTTGRPPSCANHDADDSVQIDQADGAVAWCAERADDGSRTVRAVARARHPVSITWTGTAAPTVHRADKTGERLSQTFSDWSTDHSVTLAAGDDVSFVVAADQDVTFESVYDAAARRGVQVLVQADAMAALSKEVPGARSVTTEDALDRIDLATCGPGAGAAGAGGNALLAACYPRPVLDALYGPSAAALAAPLARADVFGAVVGSRISAAEGELTAKTAATVHVTVAPADSHAWPTEDDEATGRYRKWLKDEDFKADWTSCGLIVCISGNGDEVIVVGTLPWRTYGRVSEQADDPLTELTNLGVPEFDAVTALTPG